jgi:hypothetical protein
MISYSKVTGTLAEGFDMKAAKWFGRLDKARKGKGHSVEMACALLEVSASTWAKWSSGAVQKPVTSAMGRIEKYCDEQASKA